MSEELKAKVIKFTEEAWNKKDLSSMDELFSPDVVSYAPGRPVSKGLEEYKEIMANYHTDYPDFHVVIDEIIAEGNTVADRWTLEATFTGPGKTAPVPGTGKKAIVKGTWIGHFVDGKIVEDRYTFDLMDWAQQIGLMPETE
jgi:steroid delta-isomerase-like uncharacterized protein